MKLHERDADQLIDHLEKRGDEYADAKERASRAENMHTTVKAAVYTALRKAGGISVEDAKAAALDNETVIDAFNELMKAETVKEKAYLALERARTACELWRTARSDMRRV